MTQRNNEMKFRYRHNERGRPDTFFLRQVLQVDSVEDFQRISWVSAKCCGYLILLEEPRPLLALAASSPDLWDYSGRCVGDAAPRRVIQVRILKHLGAYTLSFDKAFVQVVEISTSLGIV